MSDSSRNQAVSGWILDCEKMRYSNLTNVIEHFK